ncbi:Crp/Fnr family transcriptional regulator [Sphingosinicella sp. LY1275]|uniref:Crp/Fnr family transcriptional regulator n=1 Tax=Sphingosinicella sp. LY1275 TaxID=3095379 RepID=UPI002ADEE654|nr:Crp/Fnr family transcriptional regulator [Sphingosinicella sp. LY1275]MEA1015083.1 Crp/Fnr family transcriptional regulator [Sphingosinicella sp. LY1275]
MADRIGQLVTLTAGERAALEALDQRRREVPRHALMRAQRSASDQMFILRAGSAICYVILRDGSRQIHRIHYPGDLIAAPSLSFNNSIETVVALTDVVVSSFDKAMLGNLFEAHPRLAALFFAIGQVERAAITDRLTSIGRTTAEARVGALLLDKLNRLRMIDPRVGSSFKLNITQEVMADATGLTSVHVNRMLRLLAERGYIQRIDGEVSILDEDGLARLSNYENRYDDLDLSWLPPSR